MADRPPAVSVLTPVHRPQSRFLAQLHESLCEQAAVDWEWAIQIDGGRSLLRRVPHDIRQDSRVGLDANGRWLGQAVTRNIALARVRHDLLQTVDADDVLLPGALAATARTLTSESDIALAFGRTSWLRSDGARLPAKNPYPPGRIAAGRIADDWRHRGGSCPIVVGSVMWRTSHIDAHGGWPAIVAGPDVMLLLAVTTSHPARHIETATYLYRSHTAQLHRGSLRFAMRPHYRRLTRRMLSARKHAIPRDITATAPPT